MLKYTNKLYEHYVFIFIYDNIIIYNLAYKAIRLIITIISSKLIF